MPRSLPIVLVLLLLGCQREPDTQTHFKPLPPVDPAFIGRFRLQVAGDDASTPSARWCYLDLSSPKGKPQELLATVWRPDEQEISCSNLVRQGSWLRLTVERSYDARLSADGWKTTPVSENWQVQGHLVQVAPPAKPKPKPDEDSGDDDDGEQAAPAPSVELRGTVRIEREYAESGARQVRTYRFVAAKTNVAKDEAAERFEGKQEAAKKQKKAEAAQRAKEQAELEQLVKEGKG